MSLSVGSYTGAYDNKIVFFLGYDVPANGADCIFIASAADFTDTGGWHHVAVSVTDLGGGVMSASLYVDGQLEGTDTGSQNDRSVWGALRIGAPGDGSRSFNGKMDEVRVYDKAFTGAQVQGFTQTGVLNNDTDTDNPKLKVNTAVVTGPANGTLNISADGSFTYTPDTNFHGTDSFTYRANDGTANSNVATVTITVNPVNNAPTISNGATVTLAGTNEDTASVGTTANAILTSASWADVDSGPLKGIAITSRTGNGTWQYSTDGATWNAFGAVSASNALLINSATQVRYLPDGLNGETATFGFRAWDQTTGTASTNTTRAMPTRVPAAAPAPTPANWPPPRSSSPR